MRSAKVAVRRPPVRTPLPSWAPRVRVWQAASRQVRLLADKMMRQHHRDQMCIRLSGVVPHSGAQLLTHSIWLPFVATPFPLVNDEQLRI